MPAEPKYSKTKLRKAKEYLKHYKDAGDVIPSIAGLAVALDVSRESVRKWGLQTEEKPEFCHLLNMLRATQERALLNGGLGGTMSPTVARLVLMKHGHAETVKSENTVNATISPDPLPEQMTDAEFEKEYCVEPAAGSPGGTA